MARTLLPLLLVAALGCSDASGRLTVSGPLAAFTATLTGSQVVPAVTTGATGSAVLTLDDARSVLELRLDASGLGPISGGSIRLGEDGVNGGVVFDLNLGGATSFPLGRTLRASDFSATGDVLTFSDAIKALAGRRLYVSIETNAQPSGELRGQLGGATALSAEPDGAQVVPAAATSAVGEASLLLNDSRTSLLVQLTSSGLGAVSAVGIHEGAVGSNGARLFDLAVSASGDLDVTRTLTADDLSPSAGVPDFRAAVEALLAGETYLLISGNTELRGQIAPIAFANAQLDGDQVVPPVGTPASGSLNLSVRGSRQRMRVVLQVTGSGAVSGAAIRESGGGALFDLGVTSSGGFTLDRTLTAADFTAAGAVGSFAEAVDAILAGETWVDVATSAFPSGELRGQIAPSVLRCAALGGEAVQPAVTTDARGFANLSVGGSRQRVAVSLSVTGLSGSLTGVTITEAGGGVVFDLQAAGVSFPLSRSLTEADFSAAGAITSFAEAVEAFENEELFLEVSSAAFPSGELRGGIVAR